MNGQIGTLQAGSIADVVVTQLLEGEHELTDAFGVTETGAMKLEPRYIFRAGQQVGVVPRPA